MPTRVFLSGGEVPKFYDSMKQMGGKSVLMTYWTLRKNPDYLKRRKDADPDIDVFIDSGAFTFFMKGWKKPLKFYERYVRDYAKFLRKYRDYIFCAAELDIDTIVGDVAQKWREEIFEKMNKSVVPIVFVWHDTWHDENDFKAYCQRYDFVGIGSGFNDDYQRLMATARQYLTKVHVFGYTRSTEIQNYDFYSVDSTTWLLGSKYGETDIFNGKTINRYDNTKKDIRRTYRVKFENAGLDWSKIASEDYYEVIRMNMLSFVEMEAYLAKVNRVKAYWEKRMPKPMVVRSASDDGIEGYLLTQGLSKEEIGNLDMKDKRERAYLFSCLQHGRLKTIKKWIVSNPPEDVGVLFTDDAAKKIADMANPKPDELDALRRAYNLGLLVSAGARKRTSPEEFKPRFVTHKRDDPEVDPVERLDSEGMDLFYGDK